MLSPEDPKGKQSVDSCNSPPSSNQGVPSGGGGGASGSSSPTGHQHWRQLGWPRRYRPQRGLVLAPTAPSTSPADALPPLPPPSIAANVAETAARERSKNRRGRASRSRQRRQMEAPDSTEDGFKPHAIRVKAGQDVSAKIIEFAQQGKRAISVISANGAVSHVTLSQPAASGGTVTYQGHFEIVSLSGVFLPSKNRGEPKKGDELKKGDEPKNEPKNEGECSLTGGLSISFSGLDGHVFGGGVVGIMTAASTVLIVLASFRAEEKKDSEIVSIPIISVPFVRVPGSGNLAIPGETNPPTLGGPQFDSCYME